MIIEKIKNFFSGFERGAEAEMALDASKLKEFWTFVYDNWFDEVVDFSDVIIPRIYNPKEHFGVIVSANTSIIKVIKTVEKRLNMHVYLGACQDKVIKNHNRPLNKNYVVIFENNIASDRWYMDLSANDLEKRGVVGITLLERLLLEILYYQKTFNHLEGETSTLCAGSRNADNNTFNVFWNSDLGKVHVDVVRPSQYWHTMRTRAVIASSF
jgi:signal peptidase I